MSSNIWTECGGRANVRPLRTRAWRVVEAQHAFATLKLVDSVAEQDLLEQLIDGVKPPKPVGPEFARLHYLLSTPFRYPPLPHGSRFGTRAERGIWYGSEQIMTALAEKAYYALLFLEGTTAAINEVQREYSAFAIGIRSARGVDLCGRRFARARAAITSPSRYDASQALGRAMRAAGVEAFRYPSARDPDHRPNVGVFTPAAFATRRLPAAYQSWHCSASREQVRFRRKARVAATEGTAFARACFTVAGKLPAPAL